MLYFYKNQIDAALLCVNCNQLLDQPKILPCYDTICTSCEKSIQINDFKYTCLICKATHEMPNNGQLPFNKAILKMLDIKPTRVSRGKAYESYEETLNQVLSKHNCIKRSIEDGNELIADYCQNLRNEVQLAAKEVNQQVDEFRAEKIEEINDYEQCLIEINKNNYKPYREFEQVAKKLKTFHTEKVELLNQPVVEDEQIIKLNEEATDLIKKEGCKIENLKDLVFSGQYLTFEPNPQKLDSSILGITNIIEKRIFSNILTSYDQINEFVDLCKFPKYQLWNLIYRASRDGFEAAKFHAKCDNKPNTLVVIKSTSENVFGGYTEQSWSGNNTHKIDPKSFIFSFINRHNKPLKMKWSQNGGIDANANFGPTFGKSKPSDIFIADKSDENTTNKANLSCHPDYLDGSNEAKSFLAGSYNFKVAEIEVYTKK